MARFVGEPPEPFGMGIYPRYEDAAPTPEASPPMDWRSLIRAWLTFGALLLVSISPWLALGWFVWLR